MKTMHGPVPGGPHSLTRLFYWQKYDLLVYPGSEGQLVCRDCGDVSCRTISAHDRGFVTLFADGEYLYTVGINDGTLKRWSEPGKFESFICEPRIVGGSCLPGGDNRIGLINSEGDFLDCVIEAGVKVVRRTKGDFRCFMRMSGEDIAELYDKERQCEIENIQQTILSNIEKQQVEQNVNLYRKLQQSGYEKACLALQSYEGKVCQNRSVEFAAKHRLSQIVSSVYLEPEFLHRYIGIALDAGQVKCAHDIAQRFGSVLGTEVVDFVLSLVETGPMIVDLSGWDIAEFCRIWTISNQAIVGRFILEQGTSLKVPILNGSVNEIVKHLSADLPDVQIAKVPLLGPNGCSNIKMITFTRNSVGTSSAQIIPVLLQKDPNVYFALMADINDQHITNIYSHNTSVDKLLNEHKL